MITNQSGCKGGAIHPEPNKKGVIQMQKQTIEFATVTKNGVVQKIGKSTITQPKTNFNGIGIKWYEDKLKKKTN